MAYLIDTNCFIEPFRRYYTFEICPGFWDWIDRQHTLGNVFSIDMVCDELKKHQDDLSKWASAKDDKFFLPTKSDSVTMANYAAIVAWVQAADFTPAAKTEFLKGIADPFLVAHAMSYGFTIVTHEVHEPKRKNKIKIPAACINHRVDYTALPDFLKSLGAKFILSP